jgi:chromosome segregation ATPase
MATIETPPEPSTLATTVENIVFWIAAAVSVVFITLAIVKFGTVVETIRSTKQEAVTEQARLTNITSQLSDVQPRFEAAQAAIAQSRATLSGLEADIAKKQDELKAVDTSLAEKAAAVETANQRLVNLQNQIARAQEEANAPIDEARRTLAELNSQIEDSRRELNKLGELAVSKKNEMRQLDQLKREFCVSIRTLMAASDTMQQPLGPAAEFCGLLGHGPHGHPPG